MKGFVPVPPKKTDVTSQQHAVWGNRLNRSGEFDVSVALSGACENVQSSSRHALSSCDTRSCGFVVIAIVANIR
ncbi:hypothetical protein RISK_005251 [Rhodopirellula islandica]|uniref:Uncharacterized protein n=1 Tax=Rhodopirellula islandica TaxID=595434 RepID=A0A0J1B5U1_RHOIS|nr:hypothetical protein RISK_005251 [Rhodopirellula islandica]